MKNKIVFFFLLVSSWMFSQPNIYVSKSAFELGEQISIIYRLQFKNPNTNIHFSSYTTYIPAINLSNNSVSNKAFEITAPFSDTLYGKGNFTVWEGRYKLSCWDTGRYLIPSVSITLTDSVYHFKAFPLTVFYPAKIDKQEMKDIQESFTEIPFSFTRWLKQNIAWIVVLVILIILLIIWRVFKGKKIAIEVPIIDIKQHALDEIDALRDLKHTNQEELKVYFDRLSFVLKKYLSERYELELMERTTVQTSSLLIQSKVNTHTVKNIQLVLEQSDFVKFANSEVDEIHVKFITDIAKKIVIETSPKQSLYV